MRGRVSAALLIVLALAGAARAELSNAVVAAYRGKIILSRAAVSAGASDKDTIAKLKASQLAELVGKAGEDGQVWRFHYTAFLKKTGNVGLRIKYISGEKDARMSA